MLKPSQILSTISVISGFANKVGGVDTIAFVFFFPFSLLYLSSLTLSALRNLEVCFHDLFSLKMMTLPEKRQYEEDSTRSVRKQMGRAS